MTEIHITPAAVSVQARRDAQTQGRRPAEFAPDSALEESGFEPLVASPAAHIIATSRQALGAEGEWVYQVLPLAVLAEDVADEDAVLQYGAVQLFFQRARAAAPHFTADGRNADLMAAICRRLDGIPLAIELAAARVSSLGISELFAGLDDLFRLLIGGRRTALPRHQTLRATLDWSHELLSESERVILRRLGIFAGAFSLQAACAVAASAEERGCSMAKKPRRIL